MKPWRARISKFVNAGNRALGGTLHRSCRPFVAFFDWMVERAAYASRESLSSSCPQAYQVYLMSLLHLTSRFARLPFYVVWAALLFFVHTSSAQDDAVLDEIVAVVGDQILLRSEVDAMVANALRQQSGLAYSEEFWMGALDQMISQQVMAIIAKRDTTIIVTDDQVTQALESRIDQMIRQVGGQARLEEIYGKSLVRIRTELREDFRNQLLAEQVQQRKMQAIRITPSEVQAWFHQFPADSLPTLPDIVRLSHIVGFPEVTQQAKQDAHDIISTIRDSILASDVTLEEMARQFSDDPGTASAGGRIESTDLSDLVPEFAAVASRIPVSEVSQIFESPFGYHILRVNERRGETVDLNHILIKIDDSRIDPAETVDFLAAIRDSIVVHESPFELMAKRHSEEERSAQLGGRVIDPQTGERDLILESLGPLWRRVLDTLEVGEVSMPAQVELENDRQAYHIVLMQRRMPEHRVSLTTDYERIEQYALQDKRQREMERWLSQLREDVYIDLRGKAESLSVARR